MNYWTGKRAVVTGASSGLGRVIATELARQGAWLLLVARGEEKLRELAEELSQANGAIYFISADVTNPVDVERIATAVDTELGGIDLLCHCAGKSTRGEILSTTVEDHCELWELNFLAPVQLTSALQAPLEASRAHVVLLGSLASKVAPRYMGAYPASKFPLAAYAQQLRLQWGKTGPHVLLVCPGPIANEEAEGRYGQQAEGLPKAVRQGGGGAKVRKIDPQKLTQQILTACERRKVELVVPKKARLLFAISQLWPEWGDWLLSKNMAE